MLHRLTGEFITGEGHETECTTSPLLALPCAGNCSGPGRGDPLPSVLYQVQYVCYMEGVKRVPPGHGDVRQGSRYEAEVVAV